MEQLFKYKYNIGDSVYHATVESDRGIVLDVSYSIRNQLVHYTVVFGRNETDHMVCDELELSETKIFN